MRISAENGLAALSEIQQRQFRAVVLDIHVPFLGGTQLYDEPAADYPETAERTQFITAWGKKSAVRAFIERTGRPWLEKPLLTLHGP